MSNQVGYDDDMTSLIPEWEDLGVEEDDQAEPSDAGHHG